MDAPMLVKRYAVAIHEADEPASRSAEIAGSAVATICDVKTTLRARVNGPSGPEKRA